MKKIILSVILSVALLLPVVALAVPPTLQDATTKLGLVREKTGIPEDGLESTAGTVVKAVLALVGTIFFGLSIYAGIRWMTAQGNEEKVTKAKDTLEAAIIGIVIVFLAYAITAFVTGRLASGGGGVSTTSLQ